MRPPLEMTDRNRNFVSKNCPSLFPSGESLLLRSIAASHAGSNSNLSPPCTCHICHYLVLSSSAIFAKFGRGIERLAAIGGTGERPHFTFRHEYYATHGNANELKRSFSKKASNFAVT